MTWWLYSLLASVSFAGYLLCTAMSKTNAKILSLYRCVGAMVLFSPLVICIQMPSDVNFYWLSAIAGFIVAGLDYTMFWASQKYGAGPISRLSPMSIAIIFVGWLIYDVAYRDLILTWPLWRSGGVVLCIIASIICLSKMRHDPINRGAVKISVIIAIFGAFIDSTSKVILQFGELPDIGLAYMATASFFAGITSIIAYFIFMHRRVSMTQMFSRSAIITGAGLISCLSGLMFFKMYAMHGVDNPSFVVAIICMAPLWITFYHIATKTPDATNIRAGLAFVCFMIGLVLLA